MLTGELLRHEQHPRHPPYPRRSLRGAALVLQPGHAGPHQLPHRMTRGISLLLFRGCRFWHPRILLQFNYVTWRVWSFLPRSHPHPLSICFFWTSSSTSILYPSIHRRPSCSNSGRNTPSSRSGRLSGAMLPRTRTASFSICSSCWPCRCSSSG
jgi:hypothetical protein